MLQKYTSGYSSDNFAENSRAYFFIIAFVNFDSSSIRPIQGVCVLLRMICSVVGCTGPLKMRWDLIPRFFRASRVRSVWLILPREWRETTIT